MESGNSKRQRSLGETAAIVGTVIVATAATAAKLGEAIIDKAVQEAVKREIAFQVERAIEFVRYLIDQIPYI